VPSLDQEVARRRPKPQDNTDTPQGETITTLEMIPWDTPVDGSTLLQEILDLITQYVVLPQASALAVALWILHTYVYDLFYVSPRLHITSPEKRCGKSYLVTLIALLAHRAVTISNITPASLFRLIAKYQVTVVMDEADTFVLGNEDLRGILNAGHTKETAYILRTVGDDHEVRRFSVWAPTVIAGIGRLPATVQDRAITIALKRKKADEVREDLLKALRKKRVQPTASTLRQQCLRWAQDTLDTLHQSDPGIPDGVHDREANNWEPLLAIADAIGGQWPNEARNVLTSSARRDNSPDTTPAILLLQDLKTLFDQDTPTGSLHTPF
jgi:putative DNA primase/helicase